MTLFTAIKKWLRRLLGKPEEKTVQPVKTKKKLSRADKKQIEAAIARANRTDKKGKSAQDSIKERKIEELQRLIDTHENIVFFGGAATAIEIQAALDGVKEISIFNIHDKFPLYSQATWKSRLGSLQYPRGLSRECGQRSRPETLCRARRG